MKKTTIKAKAEFLDQKAEKLLLKNPSEDSSQLDKKDLLKIIQELKAQNSELLLVRETEQKQCNKYNDLYNSAPSCFFTLSQAGKIIELNPSGAKMLGKKHTDLINKTFISFVSNETKEDFNLFFDNIFSCKTKQVCNVSLINAWNSVIYVNISGLIDKNGEQCLITAVDFSEHKQLENFNDTLLFSLPYPAMYIRQKDRIIIAANKIASDLGAKTGEHCWREFGKSKFISEKEKKIASKYPNLVPNKFNIKCSFCLGDECVLESPTQTNREINAFGKIWDTYWVKVSNDVFLHYLVDITERKEIEKALQESELFLKQTQQIAMLGTYTLDLTIGTWVGSEVLDSIFGIDSNFKKTLDSWKSIIHPEWKRNIDHYFRRDILKNRINFNKEFKIIRQNDKAVRWIHGIGNLEFNDKNEPIRMIGTIRDITERKHEQSQIIRNLKFTEALLKSIPIPVFFKDTKGIYTGCNKAFSNLMGITETKLRGKSVLDLWPIEEANFHHQNDLKLLATQEFQSYESKILDKDNRLRDVIYAKNVFYDEVGQVAGIVGTFVDITDRKQTEDALRKSEEQFRTLADYTEDWEFWIDEHNNFLYCSLSCEKITGYKATDFMQNPELLSNIVHPDDQIIFHYHKQMEDEAIEMTQEIQYRIIRSDGTIRWVGHVCRPMYTESGNWIGIRGSNRDITKRKETERLLKTSEQKYKLLSENIADGIFICRGGIIEYVNKSMSRIFGYHDFEMEGLEFAHLTTIDYQHDIETFLNSSHSSNEIRIIEIECLKRDHSIVFVEMFLNYIATEKAIYGVVHDITEKKQIQKKNMVKAIIQTEEKERAYFSKELHDGLGPLLSTIKLYLQWTKRLESIKKRNEIIFKAEEIVEEALTTVKEISNKLSPHLLSNYGLSSAIQSFANKLTEANTINISFQSNANRRIEMEIEVALYRAVIECINNTIKYAKAENIDIVLYDTGTQIQIHYKDDGIGFNISKTLSEKKGLGLFNLQNRIQTIGGKIKMYSEPGHGVDYQIIVNI